VSLEIAPGEALGIVGESGSGKSVTWLAALGLLPTKARVTGSVRLEGKELVGAARSDLEQVRGKRIAMIFQDPSSCLNPVHRIGRQLVEALGLHRGLAGRAAEAEALRLLDQVGIADARRRLSDYPHLLSGGLNQRVMIAMALAGEPDLLVADEPTTALDATVEAQIVDLFEGLRIKFSGSIVFISHHLGLVAQLCDDLCVMYGGTVVETGPVAEVLANPQHPYTRALLACEIDSGAEGGRLVSIPGEVQDPVAPHVACVFAPRCAHADTRCRSSVPVLQECGVLRRVACVRWGELQ
jgi:peptide/nickel transport system ATP-binding protein